MQLGTSVLLKSGRTGWRMHIRDVYDNHYPTFVKYMDMYGLYRKLGFTSPDSLWEQNPIVEGSVVPSDYKLAE